MKQRLYVHMQYVDVPTYSNLHFFSRKGQLLYLQFHIALRSLTAVQKYIKCRWDLVYVEFSQVAPPCAPNYLHSQTKLSSCSTNPESGK